MSTNTLTILTINHLVSTKAGWKVQGCLSEHDLLADAKY